MKPGQVIGIVGGLWLMAAPAAAGYSGTGADNLHRVVGPLIATFAAIALWSATRDVRLANLPLAAVLAVAPIFGGHPGAAALVGVLSGLVIAGTTPFGGPDPSERGRGWRGVLRERDSS